ncbi:MAG: Xaa-Pro peptidase family protein [Hyphomicrobiaceae bacterium]
MTHFAPYRSRFEGKIVPRELDFPADEYQRRQLAAQQAMDTAGIDLLIIGNLADICWLTGFQTPSAGTFAALLVPAKGAFTLQVIDHEYGCARYVSTAERIESYPWYEPETGLAQHARLVAELMTGDKAHIGIDGKAPIRPDVIARRLGEGRFTWSDATGLVTQLRRTKSPLELEAMRESGRITRVAMDDTLTALRPGMRDSDVAAVLMQRMIEEGSEFPAMGPFVATGLRSSLIHTTWKRRPIAPGDHVFLEPAAAYKRYNAPMMRTAIMGQPSKMAERLTDAVETTLAILFESIRAGRTGHEVAIAAAKGFAPVKDEIFFQGAFGYSVGLALPADWAEGSTPYIAEGIEAPLVAGMTLHLPVAARVVGFGGVALSETVLVTETGCESLTADSRKLFIVT